MKSSNDSADSPVPADIITITSEELKAFLAEIGAPKFDAEDGHALSVSERLAAAASSHPPGFSRVDVRDGDIVVFHCDQVLSLEQRANISVSARRVFGEQVRVLVLDRGLSFAGVLRRDAAPSQADEIASSVKVQA